MIDRSAVIRRSEKLPIPEFIKQRKCSCDGTVIFLSKVEPRPWYSKKHTRAIAQQIA
jgi:hypothetical protein